jgi:hypothetical protein
LDGGLTYNNPVKLALDECDRLADLSGNPCHIDLVLSLGTGKEDPRNLSTGSVLQDAIPADKKMPWLKIMFTTIQNQIRLNLRTDDRWQDARQEQGVELRSRMLRINPELGYKPPRMDDVSRVSKMEATIQSSCRNGGLRDQVLEVACRLVAHMFYFQKTRDALGDKKSPVTDLPGMICCRIRNEDMFLNRLGDFVKKYSRDPHAAIFRISLAQDAAESRSDYKPLGEIQVPTDYEPDPKRKGWKFECPECVVPIESDNTSVRIELNLENARSESKWYPISGFPRQLMKEDYMMRGITAAPEDEETLLQYEQSAMEDK